MLAAAAIIVVFVLSFVSSTPMNGIARREKEKKEHYSKEELGTLSNLIEKSIWKNIDWCVWFVLVAVQTSHTVQYIQSINNCTYAAMNSEAQKLNKENPMKWNRIEWKVGEKCIHRINTRSGNEQMHEKLLLLLLFMFEVRKAM